MPPVAVTAMASIARERGLRDLVAQLQDALVEPTRSGEEESLVDALDVERRR